MSRKVVNSTLALLLVDKRLVPWSVRTFDSRVRDAIGVHNTTSQRESAGHIVENVGTKEVTF